MRHRTWPKRRQPVWEGTRVIVRDVSLLISCERILSSKAKSLCFAYLFLSLGYHVIWAPGRMRCKALEASQTRSLDLTCRIHARTYSANCPHCERMLDERSSDH
jgi:hypothetical protein